MSRALKYKHVVRALYHLGYFVDRQKGSHVMFKNVRGQITVVPKHSNGEVVSGTVNKICKDIGVSFEDFEKGIHT
jgi:predicted RNA binding protein YcfA (HicA-like mRNA interferase family)